VKQTFAVKPRGLKAPAVVRALRPAAAGAASSSHRGGPDTEGLGGGG